MLCVTNLEAGLLKGDFITVYMEKILQVKCLFKWGRITDDNAWKLKDTQ